MTVNRVCAAIVRDDAILMVLHEWQGRSWWTLPGGSIEEGETLHEAALREVREEVGLHGRLGAKLFERTYEHGTEACFAVDVDADAHASVGTDPELPVDAQMITAIAWRPLAELADDVQVALVLASRQRG